jgi:hypothetical protein
VIIGPISRASSSGPSISAVCVMRRRPDGNGSSRCETRTTSDSTGVSSMNSRSGCTFVNRYSSGSWSTNFMVPVVPLANAPLRVISSACASQLGQVEASS